MKLSFRLVNSKHPNARPLLENLHGKFSSPNAWYVIAMERRKPVGFVEFEKRTRNHRPVLMTFHTYVVPGRRGNDIAKALAGYLVRFASTRSIRIIEREHQTQSMIRVSVSLERDVNQGKKIRDRRVPPHRVFVHWPKHGMPWVRIRIPLRKKGPLKSRNRAVR